MPAPGRARRRRRPPGSASSSGRFESCAEQTRSCCRIGFLRGGARPRLPLIVDYIEEHRDAFGVEPICTVLSLSLIHISEPTRLGMISYAVFCLKKKKNQKIYYNIR